MKTNRTLSSHLLAALAALVLLASLASAQSLGEIAREQRAKKGVPAKKNRVYTNDNLPREGGLSTTAVEPETKAKEGEKAKTGEAGKEGEDKTADTAKARAELEKAYREKFAKLRESQAFEEKKLDVLQREFNLASVQFYSDPNKALTEQTTRSELNKRQQEIEKQKQAIENAKKAIADMEEELRKNNLPPGWAR